jgi:hypothetical protein
MFARFLSTPAPRRAAPPRAHRVVPQLELLENRDCPAVSITSLAAVPGAHRMVHITGQVLDDTQGATVTVNVTGFVSGNTSADSSGHFAVDLHATPATSPASPGNMLSGGNGPEVTLGNVTAVAVDSAQAISAAASAAVVDVAPHITCLVPTQNLGTLWSFSGEVADSTGPVDVYFSGLAALQGLSATTSDNGAFLLGVDLQHQTGQVTAYAVDCWGVQSTYECCLVF